MGKHPVIFRNTILRKVLVMIFWLAVWQGIAMLVGKPVLFASPIRTAQALWEQLPQEDFWLSAGNSLLHIAAGFCLAFLAGILIGAAAWRLPALRSLLSPLLTFMKSVPVASFIILALVWFDSENLAVIVAAIIVFPLIYFAVISGLDSTDERLLEMSRVFRVRKLRSVWDIYRPAVMPYLLTACSSALGMSWKAGIAAEVIGTPLHSIGEQMYYSKLYMNTAEVFAWTAVVIVLSLAFEKLVLHLLRLVGGHHGHKA